MFVLITTFKNMVVKFVGGCSVVTCSYVIIYSMSANCFTVITAAVYIKMICIIETLHC